MIFFPANSVRATSSKILRKLWRYWKNNYEKKTFFVFSLILIFVMAFTAMTGCSDSKETGAPAETSGGDTRTLVGTIEDIANATIAVRDEEGETYIFERDDSLVVSTDGLMLIGEDIHVVDVGELTQSESVQDVKVLSFYIEAVSYTHLDVYKRQLFMMPRYRPDTL